MNVQQVVKEFVALLDARLAAQGKSLDSLCSAEGVRELEAEALGLMREVVNKSLEVQLQAQADRQDARAQACPQCGAGLHRAGKKNGF